MEYFAAYAVPIRNIHKIFNDSAVIDTINEQFGSDINTYINDAITKLANIILKKQDLKTTDEAHENPEDFKKTASTAS